MGWVLADQEEPQLAVMKNGHIAWNEATHRLLRYPNRVNVFHNATTGTLALQGGGAQYVVSISDDNIYSIACQAALDTMGIGSLEIIYRVTPQTFEPEGTPNPAQPYLDGAVWVPLPE